VYAHSGIALSNGKESLVSARVGKRMRALGLSDFDDYLNRLQDDKSGEETIQLLDAISTNVTSFFREPEHFDVVASACAQWMKEGQRRFRFWSAASSTGEEPYSLSMTLLETFGNVVSDWRILATDISTRVLQKAQEGVYKPDALKTVSAAYRDRYFREVRGEEPRFQVKEVVRAPVTYRRLNLSTPPFPMKGPLDIVFCRNVMIYFDNDVRSRLLNEISRLLKPGGYLLVGHAESLTGLMCKLKAVRPSIYVRP
jgi:chemotaxis protein methyltransferase CheR